MEVERKQPRGLIVFVCSVHFEFITVSSYLQNEEYN